MTDVEVKIRLRQGESEIEVSGTRAEVDSLLERWWRAAPSDAKAPRPSRDGVPEDNESVDQELDLEAVNPNAVANAIKEHERAAQITNVLHGHSRWDKIRLVLWAARQQLTSGDVHRILNALDVKTTLPNISTSLKENSGKLITSGARKSGGTIIKYRLTSNERSEFESSLLGAK